MVWPGGIIPNKPFRAVTKIRLRSPAAAATVEPTDNPSKWRIVFDEPQSAVTPGQSVVLYQDDVIVGGGVIEKGL
jgi:tRNA-specific 2-thiouridylase